MSSDAFVVSAQSVFARDVATVREHFFDMDHAVRDHLYEGARMQWLAPQEPGELRLRLEYRILGIAHADEFLLTREDDAVVRTYVGGPLEGTKLRATFNSLGENQTEVTLAAHVPSVGLMRVFGGLVRVSIQKTLDKILDAHKADLERGYEPRKARGNLAAALTSIRAPIDAREPKAGPKRFALVAPLAEAACVAAMADGEIDEPERETVRKALRELTLGGLDESAIDAILASSMEHTLHAGVEVRCEELGTRLRSMGLAEPGVRLAVLVAEISRGIDQSELLALQRLSAAAGLEDLQLETMLKEVETELSS